ncbi:MAG: pilus assembly protein PilB [Desulfuromonadales bacterium]|nr:pilus assembly protein PilB [Desulfuromonadales bacterium]
MSNIRKGTLGEILSDSQIITADDVNSALEEQKRSGCRFGEALLNLGIVTQEDIDWALSNQLDIPYIRLKQDMIDPLAVALIPAAMARTYNCIPLIRAGGELNIALADPLNRPAVEAIERESGCSVNVSVALLREIREMIDAFYGSVQHDSMGFESTEFSEDSLEAVNADLSGGILLDYLLIYILQHRLTSLSLQPFGDVVLIRGRQGTTVATIGTLAPNHFPEFSLRLRKAAHVPQSGSGLLSFSYRSRETVFQIAMMPGEGGDFITIRLHVSARVPDRLVELHLPPAQESAFALLARAGRGITFFASRNARERDRFMDLMLEEMDTTGRNVIILGGGPGRMQKHFPRIALPESGAERARLIMDSLDHDPDILVIADVTEGSTFSAACRAAVHGKQVLAGLEMPNNRTALRQLLLYQQKNYFLPVFVNGLISFTGIQHLCPSCRVEYLPSREELAAMRLEQPPAAFYRSTGCDVCGQRGFSERCFLLDVILFDEPFLRVFEQADTVAALEDCLKLAGHQSIEQAGLRLLMDGEVSPEEYIASVIM